MDPDAASLIHRRAGDLVVQALSDTPIVVVQGARQVGESTLARQVLTDRNTPMVTLDIAAERETADPDPDAYVRRRPHAAIRRFIDAYKDRWTPFTWATTADDIRSHATGRQRTSISRQHALCFPAWTQT